MNGIVPRDIVDLSRGAIAESSRDCVKARQEAHTASAVNTVNTVIVATPVCAANAANANGAPLSSPGLFRPNETTLGPSHPTNPPP